ncbi:hypothetical protein V7138_06275 [Bacillus sp. JJ1533]|uniref:hypothetical protein n=1 Tax=Bacillus sp. JJ1533 TaxID=3122959 RepID=UPI002FFF4CB0
MIGLTICVGEHLIKVKSESIRVINIIERDFISNIETIKPPDLYIEIFEGYGTSFLNFDVEIRELGNSIRYKRADYLIHVDSIFKNAKVYVYDELALQHALLNLYSSFIVHNNWGLLLHSSCIKDNGKAHIFSGHSGAGKSTAARLSQPKELLSDEATIVKITQNEILAFNSPFNSELESNCKEYCLPLGSIQILHQSLQNNRIQLKKAEGMFQLIDKVFFWEHSHHETKRILNLLKTLVNSVPIYDLHFQKNDTFWELIS